MAKRRFLSRACGIKQAFFFSYLWFASGECSEIPYFGWNFMNVKLVEGAGECHPSRITKAHMFLIHTPARKESSGRFYSYDATRVFRSGKENAHCRISISMMRFGGHGYQAKYHGLCHHRGREIFVLIVIVIRSAQVDVRKGRMLPVIRQRREFVP